MSTPANTPCCVYRAYDIGGTLLYVGSSFTPEVRYRDHENRAAWWPFKCDMSEQWYDSEAEAREAELRAIATEHPRWNVVGRSVDHPDGLVTQASGRHAAPHLRDEIAIAREWRETQIALTRAEDRMALLKERVFQIAASRMPEVRHLRERHERLVDTG